MPRPNRKRMYGTGGLQRRGRRWRIKWRENGAVRGASFPTEELARRNLAFVLGRMAQGLPGMPPHVADYQEALWRAEQDLPREEQIGLQRLGGPFDAATLYAEAGVGAAAFSEEPEDRCDVYFVRDQAYAIKIGQTAPGCGARRIASLQTAHSSRLETMLIVPGVGGRTESALHHAFKEERIRGEWFLDSNRINRFVAFARFAWRREESEMSLPRPQFASLPTADGTPEA